MSIGESIGKFFGGLAGGGVASAASAAVDVVSKGADIVERWVPGAEKKQEMAMAIDSAIEGSVQNARAAMGPLGSGGFLGSIADGLSRLVRPVVTFYLLGVVFGLWHNSVPSTLDPWYLTQAERVLVFWFGGRMLFKDIPSAIAYLRGTKK
jgi:hypothetical protein